MPPQEHSRYTVVFASAALAPGDLYVRQLDGHEALSQLFSFELVVETTFGDALTPEQINEVLRASAYVAFGDGEEHKIHGVVREVEMLNVIEHSVVAYRLRFVPKLFDTTLTAGSWVYQDLSAPEVVKDVLKECGLHEGQDFEFRLTKSYPKYEYKVQYEETDFQFVSRVLEHEGLFYFFEHGDERAKVVFADANNAFQELDGFATLGYDPRGGIAAPEATLSSLTRAQRVIPSKVTVRDYNYRTPSVQLVGQSPIDAELGIGEHVYYGEHFKSVGDGQKLARVRSQEHFVHREVYGASSAVRGLRAGHKFTLEAHPLAHLDQQYVVTDLRHSVQQEGTTPTARSQAYHNEFNAIPYAVPFRPVRATPQPRIVGVIHGKVDAASDGVRATPVDEHGRYKVILPWDLAGTPGGKASRWIRMAQPASGSGYGVQFPLHVGTEVLLIHVNGDPDRPVIISSVPNFETASPVNSANATQSQIRTRHGITVTFDDHS